MKCYQLVVITTKCNHNPT